MAETSDDDPYEFAPEPPQVVAARRMKCQPGPGKLIQLDYRGAKKEGPASTDTDKIKNVQLPLWLLGGGVFVEVVAAFIWNHRGPEAALVGVGIDLVVGTSVMLAGILVAAKLRKIDLGNFGQAVCKLAAISIAPAAVMEFVSPILSFIPLGFIIGLVVEFVLYFALLGALFDLDESDTWFCVWVIFLVRVVVYFGMRGAGWV
jgi:hypothetical protein